MRLLTTPHCIASPQAITRPDAPTSLQPPPWAVRAAPAGANKGKPAARGTRPASAPPAPSAKAAASATGAKGKGVPAAAANAAGPLRMARPEPRYGVEHMLQDLPKVRKAKKKKAAKA
jgi:hypothetical protein